MFDVLFIRHDKLTSVLLDEIIKVKTVAWPFNYDEQCDWIKNNLKNSDIHVLLFDGKKVIAYLNLIEIEIKVDSVLYVAYGIGNVCALEKGKEWGKKLLIQVNTYLNENNKVGLLFCKDNLVKFYSENDWVLICNDQLELFNSAAGVHTFVHNTPENFIHLKFDGILF